MAAIVDLDPERPNDMLTLRLMGRAGFTVTEAAQVLDHLERLVQEAAQRDAQESDELLSLQSQLDQADERIAELESQLAAQTDA